MFLFPPPTHHYRLLLSVQLAGLTLLLLLLLLPLPLLNAIRLLKPLDTREEHIRSHLGDVEHLVRYLRVHTQAGISRKSFVDRGENDVDRTLLLGL